MKEIPLSKHGKNKGKFVALVDNDIFDIVNQFNWSYSKGYAVRDDDSTGKRKVVLLHRYIWKLKNGEIPSGLEVEHLDENGLNNQISNLRLATCSENMCNKTMQKNNKSGFKGISKEVQKGHRRKDGTYKEYTYWLAKIKKDRGKETEKKYSKRFPYTDEGFEQAKKWYIEKSLELHKKFSIYNKTK